MKSRTEITAPELRKVAVGLGPNDKAPVVRHRRVGAKIGNGSRSNALTRTRSKGHGVFRIFQQREPTHGEVKQRKALTRRTNSWPTWHVRMLTYAPAREKSCVPFVFPPNHDRAFSP
jgi:hypothetical protein